jgi:hypothetical protein
MESPRARPEAIDNGNLNYPGEITGDDEFLYRGDFCLWRMPNAGSYMETLAIEVEWPEKEDL